MVLGELCAYIRGLGLLVVASLSTWLWSAYLFFISLPFVCSFLVSFLQPFDSTKCGLTPSSHLIMSSLYSFPTRTLERTFRSFTMCLLISRLPLEYCSCSCLVYVTISPLFWSFLPTDCSPPTYSLCSCSRTPVLSYSNKTE